ncbi:MAG: 4-(cytidine 5'-diphospho)-2-C-methyl-D-erythritol kinase [Clostridiales bacterium]|nr:4-(cytidine 5'-diphospho)-2-C-methyl-D-erythritol kinase [Clostridiales bacterium]
MNPLCIAAPAKINWRLKIVGRRPGGYHLLCGLMQTISLADTVYLRESRQDTCRISPECGLTQEDDLAYKAWLLLKRELALTCCLEIVTEKRIPLGGGLAGGSADAAAVLKGANELFGLGLSREELSTLGLKLGADIPFCLMGGSAKAQGVGERLTPLPPPPPLPLLLVNPGISLPTGEVYARYAKSGLAFALEQAEEAACVKMSLALQQGDVPAINALLENDLAAAAREVCPAIAELEGRLTALGLLPLISGSGGTVFALAKNAADLAKARQALKDIPWVVEAYTVNG